jgi:primary-amine oxidase
VLVFTPGDPVDRRVRAILLDTRTDAAAEVVASVSRGAIDKADSGWRAAVTRRGITELELVRPCPLSAGSFGPPGEDGRRMRVLLFLQHHPASPRSPSPRSGWPCHGHGYTSRYLRGISAQEGARPLPSRASL